MLHDGSCNPTYWKGIGEQKPDGKTELTVGSQQVLRDLGKTTKLLESCNKGTVVKPQYCSEGSAHELSSVLTHLGSQLEGDSAFSPSVIGKLSA